MQPYLGCQFTLIYLKMKSTALLLQPGVSRLLEKSHISAPVNISSIVLSAPSAHLLSFSVFNSTRYSVPNLKLMSQPCLPHRTVKQYSPHSAVASNKASAIIMDLTSKCLETQVFD